VCFVFSKRISLKLVSHFTVGLMLATSKNKWFHCRLAYIKFNIIVNRQNYGWKVTTRNLYFRDSLTRFCGMFLVSFDKYKVCTLTERVHLVFKLLFIVEFFDFRVSAA
jgi:hypothetical protein